MVVLVVMPSIDRPPRLWPFAVHMYALPGVATLCLQLQDEHGLDVDVLLAILWQAHRGAALDDAVLERLSLTAAPAHARVLELRALRRAMASDRANEPQWQETYEHIKAAELAAERVELTMLEGTLICEPSFARPTASSSAESLATDLAPGSPAPADPAALAFAALVRHAERCGARPGAPLLRALVDTALPRSR